MLNLYLVETKKDSSNKILGELEKRSIVYHNIFDYPLDFADLIKWKMGIKSDPQDTEYKVQNKNGYYFLEGKCGLIYKRALRKRISARKMEIAKKAVNIFKFIPSIKMIAVTGSLAMRNSSEDGDIDLMFITKKGSLWTSRLLVYLAAGIFRLQRRQPFDKNQKDKLCLNMWFDESDLVWKKRNIYTSHEIAQIIPLANKDKTYERFLFENRWISNYWPNAVKIFSDKDIKLKVQENKCFIPQNLYVSVLEKVCYWIQFNHMKPKVSREVITPTRALFHPQDLGKIVLNRLTS